MGNHETIPPATRDAWLIQFADWLEIPRIRAQRLKDNPQDHKLHAYYHWVKAQRRLYYARQRQRRISSMPLSSTGFARSSSAMKHPRISEPSWSECTRHCPAASDTRTAWAIGPQGDKSGREVYQQLWHAQDSAHKRVYILASHSHFFMEDVYQTADWKNKVLPGWIVGTAGAVRYRIPPEAGPAQKAQTDVYGYMIGTVAADGSVSFEFQKLSLEDLLAVDHGTYPEALVRWCYSENKQ